MPTLNDAARNAAIADITAKFTTATLKDHQGNTVATYTIESWTAGSVGQRSTGAISGTAQRDHDFGANPGTLVLSGAGSETCTFTAGGPGSGLECIVQNDKAIPDGEVFSGKACNISNITLTLPA